MATAEFLANPAIKRLSPAERRLLVMFSGFVHAFSPPRAFFAVAGNFLDTSNPLPVDDKFRVQYWIRDATSSEPFASVQRIGNWPALSEALAVEMEKLLKDRKPPDALIGKGLNILRQASASTKAANNIGRRASYIVIPSDSNQQVRLGYDPDAESDNVNVPSIILALDDANRQIVTNLRLTKVRDQNSLSPAYVKQVSQRSPCPCGSRKRYKYCHGKNRKW
jgi:SEC-C motif